MSWKYPDQGELPPEGRFVICELNLTNWHDSFDQEGCLFVVAKLVKGKTAEEIAATNRPTLTGNDEWGNNRRPFRWHTFGAPKFLGQEVSRWMEIPR